MSVGQSILVVISYIALAILLTLSNVPKTLAQEEAEPEPLYGTTAFDIETPWRLLIYTVPGGLTGAAAIHFAFIVMAADRLVGGAWDGDTKVED